MIHAPFKREDMRTLGEALDIAEDRTGDYFKFSSGQWRRHRYDVKTLSQLTSREVVPDVFALLKKRMRWNRVLGIVIFTSSAFRITES